MLHSIAYWHTIEPDVKSSTNQSTHVSPLMYKSHTVRSRITMSSNRFKSHLLHEFSMLSTEQSLYEQAQIQIQTNTQEQKPTRPDEANTPYRVQAKIHFTSLPSTTPASISIFTLVVNARSSSEGVVFGAVAGFSFADFAGAVPV